MKKIFIVLLLQLLTSHLYFSQKRISEVKYSFIISNGAQPFISNFLLVYDYETESSVFLYNGKDTILPEKSTSEKVDESGNKLININEYVDDGEIPEYQKIFPKDSLLAFEDLYGQKHYAIIKEKLPIIKWKIEKETDHFLSQYVQKATTSFRGRHYTAWFAPGIDIPDGPFKFHGLPGLILKIKSNDGYYAYEANELKINIIPNTSFSAIQKLEEKYPKAKAYSIEEKLKIEVKNIEKETKYLMSKDPNASNVKIEIDRIELNYDDAVLKK